MANWNFMESKRGFQSCISWDVIIREPCGIRLSILIITHEKLLIDPHPWSRAALQRVIPSPWSIPLFAYPIFYDVVCLCALG
mmetsp:Transcript_9555/g.19862  ORF Transcript_9555/g.19862 Transcript_9555/m.19862 type:complete len:82 (-) Transcript_9555:117-362(-)